jgi:hypothetical protein
MLKNVLVVVVILQTRRQSVSGRYTDRVCVNVCDFQLIYVTSVCDNQMIYVTVECDIDGLCDLLYVAM